MQEFGKFLAHYWQLIVTVILMIISTVIALIRKKPTTVKVVDTVKSLILEAVPEAINKVEKYQGIDKLKAAVAFLIVYISKLTDMDAVDIRANYETFMVDAIESVLSTPTKKGGTGREEVVQSCDEKSS